MDNFTMLQNAARRQIDGERTGFASLSRVDQADRWAAWQASADMPRAERDTYSYGPAHIDSPYDEFSRAHDLPERCRAEAKCRTQYAELTHERAPCV